MIQYNCIICYYICFGFKFRQCGGTPPHGMGLTMEGRGHTLGHVGNSFMSRHHKARCMEGAATMQETLYTTHHASNIAYHTQFSIHKTSCTKHHGAVWQLHACSIHEPEDASYRTLHSTGGEGKIMVMCGCVDIAPAVYLCVLHVLMVCSFCYIVVPTILGPPSLCETGTYIM